ncbi:hypothetical protein [Solitalea koreensis]|uniref:Uncharacterized protein n=1 Tax=Solitalea koreensis TaxID=543615 RepID=A0A521CS93_9SPHI|nr:hypothetical protein [Solitalea koreensis]SMO62255.1 hypothetical protein SAMN06265350_104305 [Solitalea koreensis]
MKKWYWLFSIILYYNLNASAQTEFPQVGAIPTNRGLLLYFNEPGTYFTIELPGKNIEVIEAPQRFRIDNQEIQLYFIKKQRIALPDNVTEEKHLEAFRLRELAYLETELNEPLVCRSTFQTIGTQNFMVWNCKNPDKNLQQSLHDNSTPVIYQYSYTTLCNEVIVSFTCPQTKGTAIDPINNLLKSICSSFKTYNKEIDVCLLLTMIQNENFGTKN